VRGDAIVAPGIVSEALYTPFVASATGFEHDRNVPPAASQPSDVIKEHLSRAFQSRCDPPKAQSKGKRRKRDLDGVLRCYRVRMIPDEAQTRELKRCFGASRHAYNWTVASINAGGSKNFQERRNEYTRTNQRPTWATGVSDYLVRSGVEDAVNAFKSSLGNLRNGNIDHFDVHFRSHRRTKTEALSFEGDGDGTKKRSPLLAFRPNVFTQSTGKNRAECLVLFGSNLKATGGIRLQDNEHVIQRMLAEGNRLKESAKILWDKKTGAFHLMYTYVLPVLDDPDPEFETKRLVATDPGVRRFQTYYSPTDGCHGELLCGMRCQLEDRCFAIDARVSDVTLRANALRAGEYDQRTKRQRQHTFARKRKKLAKEHNRLRNWMATAHYSAANCLLFNYDVVVAPKLEVQSMAPRDGRVFGSKTARAMYTWSHYRFTQRLHSACARYEGRYVLSDTGEPGTSKTCCNCGYWHADLGGSSVFHCPRCNIEIDRDVAGARNNFFAAYGQAIGMGYDGVSSA
jgi:transposase